LLKTAAVTRRASASVDMLYAYTFEKQKNTDEQGFCKSVDKGILACVSDSDGSQHRSFYNGFKFFAV